MKKIVLLISISFSIFAVDLVKLPLIGIEVKHVYSNGEKEKITIEREVLDICTNIPINVDTFQSQNLASKNVDERCKKTFITTKGLIQPLSLQKGVRTLAELEVLDFILNKSLKDPSKYILVDSRTSDWFNAGTIPSSVNIPYNELAYDEDFEIEYERAYENLGVKILGKNKFDFSDAKTVVFFCNGSWCAQSPRAIKTLIKFGYPKEKIMWYRGGIASWAGVSLSLTKNIETK